MVKKNESKEIDLRNRVYAFVDLHPEMTSASVVKHLKLEGYARSTLYDIPKRKENKIGVIRKIGSGRLATKMTKSQIKRLKTKVDHTHGISQSKLARIFNVSQSYICETLKTKTSIRYRKKIKVPKRTDQQKAVLRTKCRKLCELFQRKEVAIDYKSYFRLSNSDLSGNAGYYTLDSKQTPDSVKLKRVAKYEQKLLVWVAISTSGMSRHFIVLSGQAVNRTVYIEKCLKARLIPYINSLQNKGDVIFWPDLASSHYSKETLSFLESENVKIVPKASNPANAPEVRPIEDFWTEIKRIVYDSGWEAKDLDQLRDRINYGFKKIPMERVHSLGKKSHTRVYAVRRHGLKNL